MFLRVFSFLILIIFVTSCDKFSFIKNTNTANEIELDTIVDFSSVDVSPSFNVCKSIIDKAKKTACFRTTIHKKIGEELQQYSFAIKDSIAETVFVNLLINVEGNIILEEIKASDSLKTQLPALDSLLQLSIHNLPKIYPAIKRGIPVNTKYRLPIRIELKE